MSELNHRETHLKRPFGVWLLTIVNALFFAYYFALSAVAASQMGVAVGLVLTSVLTLGIIVASIGAWRGTNIGRLSLMVLLAAYCVLQAGNQLVVALFPQQIQATGNLDPQTFWVVSSIKVLFPLMWAGLNAWYFSRGRVVAYYRRPTAQSPSIEEGLMANDQIPRKDMVSLILLVPIALFLLLKALVVFNALTRGVTIMEFVYLVDPTNPSWAGIAIYVMILVVAVRRYRRRKASGRALSSTSE